jgi:hypothetical protein
MFSMLEGLDKGLFGGNEGDDVADTEVQGAIEKFKSENNGREPTEQEVEQTLDKMMQAKESGGTGPSADELAEIKKQVKEEYKMNNGGKEPTEAEVTKIMNDMDEVVGKRIDDIPGMFG